MAYRYRSLTKYGLGRKMVKLCKVTKNRLQRICIRFFTGFYYAITLISIIWSKQLVIVLAFAPWLLIMSILLFYFESWQVDVRPNSISSKVFHIKTATYSYQQIQDAYITYSFTNHHYIMLTFTDGKKIKFRLEDENARNAVRIISSHYTIRILN